LRDNWTGLKAKNVLVFGVNPQSAGSHAGFRQKQKLPFPLLVDEGQRGRQLIARMAVSLSGRCI
jgi:peroxiredoxin Q/BCP